jgi:hypothetical protein
VFDSVADGSTGWCFCLFSFCNFLWVLKVFEDVGGR